ncbi:hypothetical protein LVD15_01260 [Fulvivirga maritima]|uniref:hypothetical protein n=1 Tax=Fulvivirga maritima TaxID=2904247 RepID=UPI001F254AB9|nr:hypothetical protein [Fulvivirga maritima]UII27081.1 hypothetical protein LVD15_01260 [Fulvivirga maritima]
MRITNILLIAMMGIAAAACQDDDKVRVPDLEDGANVRIQLDADFTNLNFDDIASAQIQYNVFSENENIESIAITMVYNNAQTGEVSDSIPVVTYTQSDFQNGAIMNETWTAAELASLIGLSGPEAFNGGDYMEFFNTTTLTDGRVFPSETINGNLNVPPGIVNSAATQIFSVGWTSFVACPLPVNYEGTYNVVLTSGCADGFVPDDGPSGTVTLTQENGPIYTLSDFTVFGFDGRSVEVLFICGRVLIINQSPGLSCGTADVVYNTSVLGAGTYDPEAEELSFSLIYDSVTACGGPFEGCENQFVISAE